MPQQLQTALAEYQTRQARTSHPNGSFDRASRWYPNADEEQSCCSHIRTPSRAWPHSLNRHCRSAAHVAALFGVNVTELRRAIRAAREVA